MQLVSKISNLCGPPDPPTSRTDRQSDRRTDRQTDDMQSQYRAGKIIQKAMKSTLEADISEVVHENVAYVVRSLFVKMLISHHKTVALHLLTLYT